MRRDFMSTGNQDDETSVREDLPGGASGSRRLVLQGGIAAVALALMQAGASASPTLQRGSLSRGAPKEETLDGLTILNALERAGLDPKRLDLTSILGPRSDIEELNKLLHEPASARKAGGYWDGFTLVIGKA
jgi:hypothetical protein